MQGLTILAWCIGSSADLRMSAWASKVTVADALGELMSAPINPCCRLLGIGQHAQRERREDRPANGSRSAGFAPSSKWRQTPVEAGKPRPYSARSRALPARAFNSAFSRATSASARDGAAPSAASGWCWWHDRRNRHHDRLARGLPGDDSWVGTHAWPVDLGFVR